jgi:hypothetical protein
MSGRLAAVVACILGCKWTSPAIAELLVTSDGHVLARNEGDCGHNNYIGTAANLEANWRRLLDAAELTVAEHQEAETAYQRSAHCGLV